MELKKLSNEVGTARELTYLDQMRTVGGYGAIHRMHSNLKPAKVKLIQFQDMAAAESALSTSM